jgi:hypothetical protein
MVWLLIKPENHKLISNKKDIETKYYII